MSLANALQKRFWRTRKKSDLDNSIKAMQEAVHVTSWTDSCRPQRLASLACCLSERYQFSSSQLDHDRAILALEEAVMIAEARDEDGICDINYISVQTM